MKINTIASLGEHSMDASVIPVHWLAQEVGQYGPESDAESKLMVGLAIKLGSSLGMLSTVDDKIPGSVIGMTGYLADVSDSLDNIVSLGITAIFDKDSVKNFDLKQYGVEDIICWETFTYKGKTYMIPIGG